MAVHSIVRGTARVVECSVVERRKDRSLPAVALSTDWGTDLTGTTLATATVDTHSESTAQGL